MVRFSIIICAFNAASRLQKTLEYLALIDYPSDLLEIIVVDNNSSDGTKELASNVWKDLNSNFSFRILLENNQGLSHARKCGVQEAMYEYVIFCDDDNWLNSQYLRVANPYKFRFHL